MSKCCIVNVDPLKSGPISRMEVSPNGSYLVAYSKISNTIVGWNIDDIKEDEEDNELEDDIIEVELRDRTHFCVSDDKKLAYIDDYNMLSKYCIIYCIDFDYDLIRCS